MCNVGEGFIPSLDLANATIAGGDKPRPYGCALNPET